MERELKGVAVKLGSLKGVGRDGTLVLVSEDLTKIKSVTDVAPTFQSAIENWKKIEPQLMEINRRLNSEGILGSMPYDPNEMAAPLPRAYQWLDGSAYVNHVELVRRARGASMPDSFWADPLMYQGGSDSFLGATDPIYIKDESWGVDFEGELAVIVDDVPLGVTPKQALKHIKFLMLLNDISLRNLIPEELGKGFGFVHGKPPTSFAPVAVTVNSLGKYWRDGKLHLPLFVYLNRRKIGWVNAGVDMTFDFPSLVAHAAKTRPLGAGTIVGSGTVSNADQRHGYSCIAEIRMIETINNGVPETPFMQYGDRIELDIQDDEGKSIFGSIDQYVKKWPSGEED